MTRFEVLSLSSKQLLQELNQHYDYTAEDLKYLQKRLLITVKQDSYDRAVEAMIKAGVVSRGHRAALIRLVDKVQDLLKSANVRHWSG